MGWTWRVLLDPSQLVELGRHQVARFERSVARRGGACRPRGWMCACHRYRHRPHPRRCRFGAFGTGDGDGAIPFSAWAVCKMC